MRITKANNRQRATLLLAMLGGFTAASASAEDTSISPDRPDFVESSNVVAPGIVQIEIGLNLEQDDQADEPTRSSTTPTLIRYGIGSNLELRLETDGRIDQRTHTESGTQSEIGTADLSLGIKWHVKDGDELIHHPSIALLLHADLPSGSHAFRGEGVRPSLRGVAEWEFSNESSVGIMPGIVYDQVDGHRFWSGIFAITTGYQLAKPLRGFLEVAAQQLAHASDGGNVVTYDAGLMYTLTQSLQIDCYVSRGANSNTANWNVGGGLAIRF